MAAALLLYGPWTDDAAELAGWDVERFQEIADIDGQPWIDEPVEYPPGSVLILETIAGSDIVGTHRLLVSLSLIVDLGIAVVIAGLRSQRAATAYLALGLPLVPMGLLRLDLWSVGLAVLGAAALAKRANKLFALAATAAALIKAWPVLLLAAAWAIGRRTAVLYAMIAMAITGLAWLAYGGWSLDPLRQVLTLRGAEGWHLESVPGSVIALFTDTQATLQFNAYRIGSIQRPFVVAGQFATMVTTIVLVVRARRFVEPGTSDRPSRWDGAQVDLQTAAIVMLGATAALIVTAPLLSPQFLLWLTPWAALTIPRDREDEEKPNGSPAGPIRWLLPLTAVATILTGATLAAFGPEDLGQPIAALLLLARDGVLIAIAGCAIGALTPRRLPMAQTE